MSKPYSDKFCPKPFEYIYPNLRGKWSPCCHSTGKGAQAYNFENLSFDEYWFDNEQLDDLRDSLISGNLSDRAKSYCNECFKREEEGLDSFRKTAYDRMDHKIMSSLIDAYNKTGMVIPNKPILSIKVKFSNLCNLSCYMCGSGASTSKAVEVLKMTDEEIKLYGEDKRDIVIEENGQRNIDSLKQIIDSVGGQVASVVFSGGEPLIIQEHFDLLDYILESKLRVNVTFNTNLTKNVDKLLHYSQFTNVMSVCASIDDLHERDDYIRYGDKFSRVIENLDKVTQQPYVRVSVNITWSILNIANAENIIKFYADRNIPIVRPLNIVNNRDYLHISNHPMRDQLIDKYSKSDSLVLRDLAKALGRDPADGGLEKCKMYLNTLDRIRGTNHKKIFPDLYPNEIPTVTI